MNKAVIYVRVSTKDQEREGYSIPAQLQLLRDYAQKKCFEVVKEFRESESAGKAGRKAFLEMTSLIENDKSITAILVEKTDRLYRNFKDQVVIDDLGINIHFVKDNRIIGKDSKPSDKFVHDIETAQARFYLNNLSQEVKKGLNQKASEGKYPSGIMPLGYFRDRHSKSIEIDQSRASLIRRLFELYSQGDASIDDLYQYSKSAGFTYPKSGRTISRSEIERMLKKVFYTGKFYWNNQVYQGDHPAIIDSALYDAVQDAFQRRANGRFSKKQIFTFSRLIDCGICGHTVTAEIKKGKYVYYHCTGYGKIHKVQFVPEKSIDTQFAGIIAKASIPYDWYEFLSDSLENEFRSRKISLARERDKLESEKEKVENYMKKSFQEKINGLISEEFFRSVYNDYQRQLDAVNFRLNNLSESVSRDFDFAKKAIELSHQAERLYLKANLSQKRRLINTLLSNCQLNGKTLCPTYSPLYDALVKGIESNNKRRGRDSNPG